METTTLKRRTASLRWDKFVFSSMFLVFAGFAVFDFKAAIQAGNWLRWDLLTGAILTVAAFAMFKHCLRLFRFSAPELNTIAWNGDGLGRTVLGRREGWPWREASPFEITKMRLSRDPMIRFTVPGKEQRRGIFGWLTGPKAPPGKRYIYIGDDYELPLEDIAARLNECRERVVRRPGRATAAPRA